MTGGPSRFRWIACHALNHLFQLILFFALLVLLGKAMGSCGCFDAPAPGKEKKIH